MAGNVVLRGGLVVDGTGARARRGDVSIIDGRVAEVGKVEASGSTELDVEGLIVAPGFIDVHTHYDAQVCWDPSLGSISQYGVTTVVMGNCGIGVAPLRRDGVEYLIQLLASVEGMPTSALTEGLSWDWSSYADYLGQLDRPSGVNVVSLVGHSPLRFAVMGEAASERAATPDELELMCSELRSALRAGAWGFSSSVAHTHNDLAGRPAPSRLADLTEFEALADVLGEFPFGIVGISPESKMRGLSEADRSLLHMLSVRGGASVNWNPLVHSPLMPELSRINLDACAEVSRDGARVYGVFNPAGTGGSRVDLNTLFLFGFLPHWKGLQRLSRAEKIKAFSDPAVREQLADDLVHDTSMGVQTARLRTMWDILRITEVHTPENRRLVGRLVGDVAQETGRSPFDTFLDIAVADDLRTVFMQEDSRDDDPDSREAFAAMSSSPHVLYGGSDAGAHIDMLANESLPVRVLQSRVREHDDLELEEVVRRFTSAIADAIGLPGRGRLAPGHAGDVVVFDISEVRAGDAFVAHDLPGGAGRMSTKAHGVAYTIIDGSVVIDHGESTGSLPGRLLRPLAA